MSRRVKQYIVEELQRRYGDLDSALVVNIIGLDAISNNQLRRRLRAKNIEMHVVKNSLTRVALQGKPLEPLAKGLDGPCALVTGGDSVIDTAKELVAAAREFAKIELKFGMLEGEPELLPLEQIAKMKGRRELYADLAACALSPARKLAGCLAGPAGLVAGCLKAIAEKEEQSEQAAA